MEYLRRKMGGRWEEEGRGMNGKWMGNEWGKRMDWEGFASFFLIFLVSSIILYIFAAHLVLHRSYSCRIFIKNARIK